MSALSPARWLPHGEAMVLIDHVVHWDRDGLSARSARHRAPAHPLAGADGVVAAVHLLEYAAQAAAIHIGLVQDGDLQATPATVVDTGPDTTPDAGPDAGPDAVVLPAVQPGVIAFVREIEFDVAGIAPSAPPLCIEVRRRAAIPGGMAYAFTVAIAACAEGDPVVGDARVEIARGVFGVVLRAGAHGGPPGAPATADGNAPAGGALR